MVQPKKVLWSGAGDDTAPLKENDARGQQQGFAQIVRDEHDRFAEAPRQSAKFALKFGPSNRIERAKRLVHQQDGRIGGKGPSHANALALSPGEFAGTPMRKFAGIEANKPQHFIDAVSGAAGVPMFQNGNEGDVFCHREMGEKACLLNDVTDASAEADEVPIAGRAPLDEDFPF